MNDYYNVEYMRSTSDWASFRIEEMEEKAGYEPFISMGPGYSEFETMDEEDELIMDDCYYQSLSKRLEAFIHEEAIRECYGLKFKYRKN